MAQAKRMVLNSLQTQGEIQLPIPREHYKYILGKGGLKLKNLELQSTAKIHISKETDLITITGTKEGIAMAKHEIQIISDQQVSSLQIFLLVGTGICLVLFYIYRVVPYAPAFSHSFLLLVTVAKGIGLKHHPIFLLLGT